MTNVAESTKEHAEAKQPKPTAEEKAAAKAAAKAEKDRIKAEEKAAKQAEKEAAKVAAAEAKAAQANAPKDTKNGVTRPARGVTLSVWATADELSRAAGKPTDRASVVDALKGKVEVGTVHTQFGRWRKYYGLVETKEERQVRLENTRLEKAKKQAETKARKEAEKAVKEAEKAAKLAAKEAEKAAKSQEQQATA